MGDWWRFLVLPTKITCLHCGEYAHYLYGLHSEPRMWGSEQKRFPYEDWHQLHIINRQPLSQTDVVDMDDDLKAGIINKTVYNYSVLDHFVTVLHHECQGFTVPEYIEYAQACSTVDALKKAKLSFLGNDFLTHLVIVAILCYNKRTRRCCYGNN